MTKTITVTRKLKLVKTTCQNALPTDSNNVYLDNRGSASESDTTRLGDTQTRAFMAGVRGIAPANADALPVVIDSAGQLGTVSPTGIASLAANTFAGTQAIDGGNIDLEPSTATTGVLAYKNSVVKSLLWADPF